MSPQKVTPCLWFDTQAEEAANFYVSVFRNSKIIRTERYPDAGREIHGKPAGSVMIVVFSLDGQEFTALNGGANFKFDEAVSFQIACADQEEIDYFWTTLTADGGEEGPCGWLKDRFGLSWQVVPAAMQAVFAGPDPAKRNRAMDAMLKMKKPILADFERALADR